MHSLHKALRGFVALLRGERASMEAMPRLFEARLRLSAPDFRRAMAASRMPEVDGRPVIGHREAAGYPVHATFPSAVKADPR